MPEYFIMYAIIEKYSAVPGAMTNAVWKESIVYKAGWL